MSKAVVVAVPVQPTLVGVHSDGTLAYVTARGRQCRLHVGQTRITPQTLLDMAEADLAEAARLMERSNEYRALADQLAAHNEQHDARLDRELELRTRKAS